MNANLLEKHAKSFYWASFFLSKETFKKCSSLYNFCRTLDDIVDDNNELEVKRENFLKFKEEFINKDFKSSIIKEMWSTINTENISTKIVFDLFDGVETDLKDRVEISKKKDLFIYSYRVAGTVGLMMSKILKVKNKEALKGAIDLGIAMQLTNISRDVIEDSKANRFYINKHFEEISSTINLADTFYENSFYSIKDIPISFRFSILVARRVYRKIGYKILNKKNLKNYENSGKIYVSNTEKALETFFSIFDLIKLIFTFKKDDQIKHDHILINEEINLNERI